MKIPARTVEVSAALVVLSLYFLLKAAFGVLICDDAYITLGHARSWVSGLGPVMSAQNPVSATSTPLFTALLALESLAFRTQDFELLAYFTGAAADLACLLLVHRIAARGLRLPGPFALAAAAACGLSVNFLAVSAYGMETPLYAALGLAAAWLRLFAPRPFPWLFPVCLCAAAIRPEGGLIAAAALIAGWRLDAPAGRGVRVRRALLVCAAAAAGLALFFLFYRHAYGHWLPHSVLAKRLEVRVGWAEALWSWIANVFYKGPTLGGLKAVTALNLAVLAGAAAGWLREREGARTAAAAPESGGPGSLVAGSPRPFPRLLLLWPAAYFLFFIATRSSHILFTWYYLPVLPFLILALAHGWARLLAGRLGERTVFAGVLAFAVYAAAQTFLQGIPGKHRFLKSAREDRYRAAASILNALPGRAPTAMIDEVGALAYFSRARILDTHGLLSPEALPFLAPTPEGYWTRLAAMRKRENPEWILALRETGLEGRFQDGEADLYAGYRRIHVLRLPPHGYNLEMWARPAPGDPTRFAAR